MTKYALLIVEMTSGVIKYQFRNKNRKIFSIFFETKWFKLEWLLSAEDQNHIFFLFIVMHRDFFMITKNPYDFLFYKILIKKFSVRSILLRSLRNTLSQTSVFSRHMRKSMEISLDMKCLTHAYECSVITKNPYEFQFNNKQTLLACVIKSNDHLFYSTCHQNLLSIFIYNLSATY